MRGERATADARDLVAGQALEIVQDQNGPIVGRESIDDITDAIVHLVDDDRHFG